MSGPTRSTHPPDQPADAQALAARLGGLLLTIGGGLAIVLCFTVPGFVHGHSAPALAAGGVAFVTGACCMTWAARVPHWFVRGIGPLGIFLIAASSVLTKTTGDGSELLYLWPVLFTAYFLSLRDAVCTVVLIAVTYPPIAIWTHGTLGISPSVYMIGTSIVTLVVTTSLRRQVNRTVASVAREARTDKLTDLPNRRSWDDGLAGLVAGQPPLCLLMIDLDLFKRLNDTHGHAAGDTALALVAGVLRTQTRQTDLLARIGGEEFAVALRDCALEDGMKRAEEIRYAVETRSVGWMSPLTVSIGVAARGTDTSTCEELMARADAALYEAKRSGRNTVRTLSDARN